MYLFYLRLPTGTGRYIEPKLNIFNMK